MSERIVITGVGIIASNGEGKDAFWTALKKGQVGYKPITLFDTEQFNTNIAGECTDFDPTIYMGKKGLRTLDRATKLICSAARLCIDDSALKITDENTDDVGVSVGTTFGSLKSIAEFDEVTLKEGPRYTNPALFPNTVINSPASQISIWNNIQGFNTTISTGFTSSIDAMNYASDYILMDRVKVVYTGSVEELCKHTFFGFHVLQYLSGSVKGQEFINCPFDQRRNGATFGEGACIICFEELEHAKARNAHIYAEVKGFGYYFDPYRIHKFNPRGTGMIEAMKNTLDDAQLNPEEIDYICANANSTVAADKIETAAIKNVFGNHSRKIPVSSIKSMTGECYSASGSFATAAAIGVLEQDFIPPTVGLENADPECDLDYVSREARNMHVNNILINSFGVNGSNSCMIISRYNG